MELLIFFSFSMFFSFVFSIRDRIPLGILMEEGDNQELIPLATSIYANNLIHPSIDYKMNYKIIPTNDPYESSDAICNITSSNNGVAAILSSISSENSAILESISAQMEIPHIQLLWDSHPTFSHLTTLNFYPDLDLFAEGLAAIVKSLQWKSFVILYENDFSLYKLKYILRLEPYDEDKKWNNIRLKRLGPGPDYRRILKDIKYIPETNILLDCKTDRIYDILEQAQSVRMLEIFHSYFLTSLDAHTVNLTGLNYHANITTIRIFQPDHLYVRQAINNWELTERNIFKKKIKFDPYTIKTNTILMHDAIEHLIGAINELHESEKIQTTPLKCNETSKKFDSGFRIMSYMKIKPFDRALSGPISFSKNGTRNDFTINLLKGTGNITLNRWRAQYQNLITNRTQKEYETDIQEMFKGETLIIASRFAVPYLMYKIGHEKKVGNEKYEGYAMDLIAAISNLAKFNYRFEVVEDNELGVYDKRLGQWNGLMSEIIEHKAHMAISDLAMTSQRQQVVDFSSPFMNLGIGLMIKKPTVKDIPLFAFLDPFTPDVWAYIATLLLALSIVFYLAYRLAPNEWKNPHPCDQDPDELEIEWTFINSIWLVLGSLLQQGCDILPRTISTRIALSFWWFFSLIMYNSYTANLATFLTSEKSGITVKNVEELARQTAIKYGCVEYSDTYDFFKNSDYSTYRKMWNNMQAGKNYFVKNDDEGVRRVLTTKDSLYAFLLESTTIEYEVMTRCELKSIGNWLNSISYAIAMPMNAGYMGLINSAILNLSESGELDKLKEKWWKKQRKERLCKEEHQKEGTSSLNFRRVAGVFLVAGVGISVGYILAIIEFLWNVKNIAIEEKMTFIEALKHELRFVINFKLNTKRTKHKRSSTSLSSIEKLKTSEKR